MWQSSPGTKLSMTVGNCNLGDIRLSTWTTLISTDQNQAQGLFYEVKIIWALFTCSKNALPKIHQIQPQNWPAH